MPDFYEYQTVWGKDRTAQGPLEFRKHKITGQVSWRYNGSGWSKKSIPAEIAVLFEGVKDA